MVRTPALASVVDRTAAALKEFNPAVIQGLDVLPIVVRHEELFDRSMTQEETAEYVATVVQAYDSKCAFNDVASGDFAFLSFRDGFASVIAHEETADELRELMALIPGGVEEASFGAIVSAALETLRRGPALDADVRRILAMKPGEAVVVDRPEWGPILAEDWAPHEGRLYDTHSFRIVVRAEGRFDGSRAFDFRIQSRFSQGPWSDSDLGMGPPSGDYPFTMYVWSEEEEEEEVVDTLDAFRRLTALEARNAERASRHVAERLGVTYEHLCADDLTDECRAEIAARTRKEAA